MIGDSQLIRQYAAERSEAAFAELVRRHLKMVYAAALRQVNGDTHLAEDVAQSVFADLARKAGRLQHEGSIAGWLYTSTRFAAANAVRAEARRRAREQAAFSMNEMNSNANAGWNELRSMIDEALNHLGATDREAIVLRFFEAYEFSLVGAALGVSENAARMRVERALDKLRAVLQKRGLATTGAALAGALAGSPAAAVPAQLAAGITSAALAQAAAASAGSAPSILKLIAMNKLSIAAAGVFALSVASVLVVRILPKSNPQTGAAARPAMAAQAAPVHLAAAAAPAATTGDPNILNKIVQRHDEQARARGGQETDEVRAAWDKMQANFEDSMKEDPGVNKFGAKIMATFSPGQTLVMTGWGDTGGRNYMVFVTPQLAPVIEGVGAIPDQVLITSRFIEVPDDVLDSLGFATFKTQPNGANQPVEFLPAERADAMFRSITNTAGYDSMSPKVLARLGVQASITIGNEAGVAGNPQYLALQMGFLPSRSPDGTSLDVGLVVRYIVGTAAEDAPAEDP
jgi:RNA polymerase sigma factor (sigma-70 family)